MDINGQKAEQNEIICKELGYDSECIAFDIEQLFTSAMIDIANKTKDLNRNTSTQADFEVSDYETNDSPTEKEVADNANSLAIMFKMNSAAKMSELVKLFNGLVNAGLIQAFGNVPMSEQIIWPTIDRVDKLNIIFSYISLMPGIGMLEV